MDRNALLRWSAIALSVLLFWKFIMPMISGKKDAEQNIPVPVLVSQPGFALDKIDGDNLPEPPEGDTCTLVGNRFSADFSARGASLLHFRLTDAHYAEGNAKLDLATALRRSEMNGRPPAEQERVPLHEQWRSLRTTFRSGDANTQVAFDRMNWTLAEKSDTQCVFRYADAAVELTKTFKATGKPFELSMATEVKNLTDAPKKHALVTQTTAFHFQAEVKGNLGRVSPFLTDLSCGTDKEVLRKGREDFKEGILTVPGATRFAAVTNYYFAQAIVPQEGDVPACSIVADTLQRMWSRAGIPADDEKAGTLYRAELHYPSKELAPGASTRYVQTAYMGPKERDALAAASDGKPKLGDLINLGFFSPVAKVLVSILLFFQSKVGNWGLAIILMTVCLKLTLFPLAIPGIKSSIGMRRLRPQMEEITRKFKDDPSAKGLAQMELYRKNNVSMFGGCLPQLAQMPVWWAMYTTLQTAVEMYHTKFLWFSDLSSPDKYFILPIVLGGLGFLQARIMPQQPGQDPQQQKMMMYMMPAIFTVMMLFLPAALGVYMTTNSVLGICQALLVERIAQRMLAKEITVHKVE